MKVEQSAVEGASVGVSPARRASEVLLLGYVCLLPIHWSPLPLNLQWADILFPFLLLATGATRPTFRATTLDLLVGAYVLGALPSFLVTPDAAASSVQIAKDIYMATLYFVVAAAAARVDVVSRLARAIAWTGAVVAALCLAALALFYGVGLAVPRLGHALPVPYVGAFYRLYGTFPSPEYLVNFLIFSAPFAFMSWRNAPSRRSAIAWPLTLAATAGAALGAIAHGVVGLLAALTYDVADASAASGERARYDRRVLIRALVAATVVLIVAVNVLLVFAIRDVRVVQSRDASVGAPAYTHALHDPAGASKVSLEMTYDVMAYWLLKQVAWASFVEHPIVGGGLGSLHPATRRAEAEGRIPPGHGDDDPHSTWLGRLGETGVIGTVTLVALCIGVWTQARRALATAGATRALAVPFAAGLIGIAVNSINVDAAHFRFVWIALGALRALAPAA